MTMRLWHQSFTELGRLPTYRQAIEEHLAKVADPGTEVILHGMDSGTYETEYPGIDIRYAYLQHMHAQQIFEHAVQAERQGYDAFIINTMPDPGLQEARTLVDIPVIGYGFSAMHIAAHLGHRFGIVCFIEPLAALYASNAGKYGLSHLAGPVCPLGLTFHDVVKGYADPAPVVSAFAEVVRGLMSQGVDVVIPGEAPLALLLQRAGVHRIDDVPVVDTLATSIKTAEMLVALRRTSGMDMTRHGYFFDRVPSARVDEIVRYYRGRSISD